MIGRFDFSKGELLGRWECFGQALTYLVPPLPDEVLE